MPLARHSPTAPPLRLTSAVVRPPLAPAEPAPLTRSTQTQQKARASKCFRTLAFFSLCARVGGPPNNSPPFKAQLLRKSAFGGFPRSLRSGGLVRAGRLWFGYSVLLRPARFGAFAPPLAGHRARGARVCNFGSALSFCQGSRQAGKPALDNRKAFELFCSFIVTYAQQDKDTKRMFCIIWATPKIHGCYCSEPCRVLIPVTTAVKQNNKRFVQLSFVRLVSDCKLLDNSTRLLYNLIAGHTDVCKRLLMCRVA